MSTNSKEMELAIKIAGKIDPSFRKAMSSANSSVSSFSDKAKKVAGIAAAGIGAITAAAVTAGTALYNVGKSFDDAYDIIRVGTGATGEALAGLEQDANSVYKSVPTTLENCGTAVANFNTLLGVNGFTLQGLAKQAIQVSNILDDDLTGVIDASSRAMTQWKVPTSEMGSEMDYVFKVCQSTGVGFSDLMGSMQSYGAALQTYGYDFKGAATLLGSVSKSGYDVSAVFAGMKTGAANLAKEGFSSLAEGMETYTKKIQGASTDTEALAIAAKVFGARAATTMSAAIRSGALSVEDLQAALESNSETINTASEDTYDFTERWQLMKQQLQTAIQPAATELFSKLADKMPEITSDMQKVLPVLGAVAEAVVDILDSTVKGGEWIIKNLPTITAAVATIVGIIAANKIGAAIKSINTIFGMGTYIKAMLGAVKGGVLGLFKVIAANPVGMIIAGIGLLVTAFIYLWNNCEGFRNFWKNLWVSVQNVFSAVSAWLKNAWQDVWTFLTTDPTIQALVAMITGVFNGLQTIFGGLIDFIVGVFTGNWSQAWSGVVSIFSGIWSTITSVFKVPINGVIKLLNWFISKINTISIGPLPNWKILGEYAGAKVGFNIPQISYLANGGIVTQATNAVIGEGAEPEAVLPLSKLDAVLQQRGLGGTTNNDNHTGGVTFAPVQNFYGSVSKDDVSKANAESFEQFKRWMKQYEADRRRKVLA